MLLHRVSCIGRVSDSWLVAGDRVFWFTSVAGVWFLMYREWMTFPGNNQEVLSETIGQKIGGGVFRGFDVVGSSVSYWNFVYSMDGMLFNLKMSGKLDKVLGYKQLTAGDSYYPVIFRNDVLELYGILFMGSDKRLMVMFTPDFVNFLGYVSVTKISDDLQKGFVAPYTGVSLYDYIEFMKWFNDNDVGHDEGFLEGV